MEARNIRVDSKVSGRILAVRGRVAQARANQEKTQSSYRAEEIEEARYAVAQAGADLEEASNGYRREQVALSDHAEANWKMAVARLEKAEERFAELERGYRSQAVAAARARRGPGAPVGGRAGQGLQEIAARRVLPLTRRNHPCAAIHSPGPQPCCWPG